MAKTSPAPLERPAGAPGARAPARLGVALALVPAALALVPAAAALAPPQDAEGPTLGAALDPLLARAHARPEATAWLTLEAWPAWDDAAWDTTAPWTRWSDAVRALRAARAEAEGEESAAARRARGALALCALAQGRFEEAWEHLARAGDPDALAALVPRLLPGAAPGAVDGSGALPGGARLAPALPPALGIDPREAREMRSAPFRLGAATLTLRVYFEPGSGVQLDLEHVAGGPAALALAIPVPLEAALERVYVDWDEVTPEAGGVRLELSDERRAISVWATLDYRAPAFPRTLPEALARALARAGVRAAQDAPPRAARFAEILAGLLDVPLAAGEPPSDGLAPLELSAAAAAELGALVGAAERFLLERPAPAEPGAGAEKEAGSPPGH